MLVFIKEIGRLHKDADTNESFVFITCYSVSFISNWLSIYKQKFPSLRDVQERVSCSLTTHLTLLTR